MLVAQEDDGPAPSHGQPGERRRVCAWLSVSTLGGLAGFAAFGLSWSDPVAGFVIAAFAVREGQEAWEGELV